MGSLFFDGIGCSMADIGGIGILSFQKKAIPPGKIKKILIPGIF
jgi:hypothetical protein